MKKNKPKPYIDYSEAHYLLNLYEFINRANQMRGGMLQQLDFLQRHLQIVQTQINDMKKMFSLVENTNAGIGSFDNDIEALRTFAWEAGLTKTLFEKLKGRNFRNRFTGLNKSDPVQENEIKDIYPDD